MPENKEENLSKERELVIARLEILSSELHFSSGINFQNFSRDEIIDQIRSNTTVGQEFVKTEMDFLRAMKDGQLLKSLIIDHTTNVQNTVGNQS